MRAPRVAAATGLVLLALGLTSCYWSASASSAPSLEDIAAADGTTVVPAVVRRHARNLRQAGVGPPLRKICHDTCNKARNGICEEGRPGRIQVKAPYLLAYCDLGTDCEDCGPWLTSAGNVPWEDPNVVGPVKYLKIRDVQVRVRNASVPDSMPFVFAYTDPQLDFDVSYHVQNTGVLEAAISVITYQILSKRCLREDGSRALVVDVGANFGWFSVLAARAGCRVIAFEPVPLFRSFLEYNIHLNDLANLIEVRANVVSHETGKMLSMVVPTRGIWGTAGIDGLNIDSSIQSEHNTIQVPSVRLEDEIKRDVLLMKVDVEGWEWSVMLGAEGLLRGQYRVENIIMEYSPGVPERHFKWDQMRATPMMLNDLISKYGYRIAHIGSAEKHNSAGWNATLGPLREVTLDNLKYDIMDVKKWQADQMACPIPPGMTAFPNWQQCGGVPEGLSPRSLRSELSHNTNLWAARSDNAEMTALMALQGRSGILDPSDPPDKYFQTNPQGFGMGSRICQGMEPQWQVKHRCRCSDPGLCGEEEETILRAAARGAVPQNYVLP